MGDKHAGEYAQRPTVRECKRATAISATLVAFLGTLLTFRLGPPGLLLAYFLFIASCAFAQWVDAWIDAHNRIADTHDTDSYPS